MQESFKRSFRNKVFHQNYNQIIIVFIRMHVGFQGLKIYKTVHTWSQAPAAQDQKSASKPSGATRNTVRLFLTWFQDYL